jgi:fumarate reductase iron-sulfur subunit
MSDPLIQVEVLRYRPETDEEPVFQSYRVPYSDDLVVLDALTYIKDNLDRTLSFRWSCHMAVCGSCGMIVNGEPKLSCHTFLREYYPANVRIEPLTNFPIERDLVTVSDDFMEKLASVKPYAIADEECSVSAGETLQSPAELNDFKQYTMCINCMLCYAACPQMGLTPDFVGPAALALAHRYNIDTRDAGRMQRQEIAASNKGVWDCTFVGACSQACPKSVDPAAAIQQTKIASTIDWYKALLPPWGER